MQVQSRILKRSVCFTIAILFFICGCNQGKSSSSSSQQTPPSPPQAQPKKKVTPQAQAPLPDMPKPTCTSLPELKSDAIELPIEDLRSVSLTSYNMVLAQSHIKTQFLLQKKETRLLVSIQLSERANVSDPDALAIIDCKFMDDTPDGSLTGNLQAPVAASASDVSLQGWIHLDYNVFGKNYDSKDILRVYSQAISKYSTLKKFKDALNAYGQAHLYRINAEQFELRSSQVADNGKIRYTVHTRYVFHTVK